MTRHARSMPLETPPATMRIVVNMKITAQNEDVHPSFRRARKVLVTSLEMTFLRFLAVADSMTSSSDIAAISLAAVSSSVVESPSSLATATTPSSVHLWPTSGSPRAALMQVASAAVGVHGVSVGRSGSVPVDAATAVESSVSVLHASGEYV